MPCVNEPATPTRQELLGKVFMDLRPNAVVQIEKVEKWFGRTVALEGITLTVRSGDFMVLLGRNGAGKSTLLRVMARMAKPNSGKVEVCGFDIRHDSEAVLHRPEILLLDEPFSGLDLEAAELLTQWMKTFVTSGKTVVMATHDLEQGLSGVNRWVFLERGKIEEELTGDYAIVRERYKQFLRERKGELS